jgi:AcrR family transcriptional regulator
MTRTSVPAYPSQVPRAGASQPAARRRAVSEPRELRARGRNTQRRLLDAGATVLATKGYHATRVDDVVKLAKTSHGTFYLYFSNKEELFRALATEVAEEMQALAEAMQPLRAGDTGRAQLQRWIKQFVELYRRHGPVVRAWTEAEIGGSQFGRLGTDLLTQFTAVIVDRVTDIAPPDLDPNIAALALVAMLERLNYYALTEQVRIEPDVVAETLARVTHASLFGG